MSQDQRLESYGKIRVHLQGSEKSGIPLTSTIKIIYKSINPKVIVLLHFLICLSSNIISLYVAGAFRNSELCRITNFSQEVIKNGR